MVNGINNINNIFNTSPTTNKSVAEIHKGFSTALNKAIDNVNRSSLQSDEIVGKFVKGEITNIHEVMIATQKAGITRQLTLEFRDKAVDAYKEVMRMQI